jgi:hypothetical protein
MIFEVSPEVEKRIREWIESEARLTKDFAGETKVEYCFDHKSGIGYSLRVDVYVGRQFVVSKDFTEYENW